MSAVDRARRHHRVLSALAFGLLALVAELVGRSLTHRLDVGGHVATPSYAQADYYPVLLAAVKGGIALLLARLSWRFVKARSAARAGHRLLEACGRRPDRSPRVRICLSPRLWLAAFSVTALIYLVQTDAERLSAGRWPLLAPWLHTSALSVFAVLAVLFALVWSVVARWLSDYERYAEATCKQAARLARAEAAAPPHRARDARVSPRRLFGLAFECRPPPVLA